jgi:hypothetical protein
MAADQRMLRFELFLAMRQWLIHREIRRAGCATDNTSKSAGRSTRIVAGLRRRCA